MRSHSKEPIVSQKRSDGLLTIAPTLAPHLARQFCPTKICLQGFGNCGVSDDLSRPFPEVHQNCGLSARKTRGRMIQLRCCDLDRTFTLLTPTFCDRTHLHVRVDGTAKICATNAGGDDS